MFSIFAFRIQSLEAHLLGRMPLACLCLLLEGLSLEVPAVKLEPWRDHVDEELHKNRGLLGGSLEILNLD